TRADAPSTCKLGRKTARSPIRSFRATGSPSSFNASLSTAPIRFLGNSFPPPWSFATKGEHAHGLEAERLVRVPQGPVQRGRELLEPGLRRTPARDEPGDA